MPPGDEDAATAARLAAVRPASPMAPEGAVRRIGLALVQAQLFGRPAPTLGRFVINRKLGEGGMGAVFEAVDPHLHRTVALKVLREPTVGPFRVDIEHEARMLARLSHQNVVTIYELGVENGEHYVCMALVDGPNLAAWLAAPAEGAGVSWREIVTHLTGAARGLAAAHRAGVVHRDLKLENVLLGSDGVARVTDFGLARLDQARAGQEADEPVPEPAPEEAPAAAARSAGPAAVTIVGTPGYVAPEVLRGGRATEKSDQYSFFVTLRVALERGAPGCPAALDELVRVGTSRDPEARLSDMDAVVSALEDLLERRPGQDQRARDVLSERVQKLWIEPVRLRAIRSHGSELPLRCEAVPALADTTTPLELGGGTSGEIALALDTLVAGVVLVGAPGAGKTIRLLGIADALLARARRHDAVTLPVVLNLSSFPAFDGTLWQWLLHELVAKYALPREQVEQWLRAGTLALLLDGLDEVTAFDRGRCVEALNRLREERPTPYVVTCREENYLALPRKLCADAALRLCPLDTATVGANLRTIRAPAHLAALAQADPELAEHLRSPLLLALFSELAQDLEGLPPSADALRDRLYEVSLDHALDALPRLAAAERQATRAGLQWLAAATERAGVTEVWLEDMQASWLATPSHRRGARALGVGFSLIISIALNLMASRLAQQPWYSGLFFGVIAASSAFVIQGSLRIVPMEAMRWSWARVRKWIPGNLALGVALGVLHGVFFDFWADLMLGTATGLLGLSVIGLVPAGRERRVHPGDGLVESLRNGLLVAPIIGLVIGAPVGYLVLPFARAFADPGSMYHTHPNPELSWAVTIGTSAAVTSLYITGALAPLMHAALRITLAMTSPLPLRLLPWFDALVARGLLHRVGGGWQFRHATFRAWLAADRARPDRATAR